MRRAVLGLFLVSGALGLGYQVLWSKLVLQFVGVSSWSYAVVLAAFMGGLAIGSHVFGRVADRVASPLRLFALLEMGIGLYAIAYLPLCSAASAAYSALVAGAEHGSGGMHGLAAKALVAGLLLLPPTALMGGTYPALVRHASSSLDAIGRRASQLYAVNAAGAVAGTLLMAFVLMPSLGIRSSLMLLALGNACVGGGAWLMARRESRDRAPAAPATEDPRGVSVRGVRAGLVLAFLAGVVSFALEVAWTRLFSLSLGSSTYSFAVILAAFIAGIAGGAALLSRVEHRISTPIVAFGWTEIGASLLILLPLPACAWMPWALGRAAQALPATDGGHRAYELLKLSACLLVMLGPALLLGVSIPLLVKAVALRLRDVGADTGAVYGWNTAGNVTGALLAGLVLLPLLGVQRLIQACGAVLALLGLAAILWGAARAATARRASLAAVPVVAALLLALFLPAWDAAWFTLVPFRRHHARDLAETRRLVADREIVLNLDDPAANVMVQVSRTPGDDRVTLLVNGKPDASSSGDVSTQLLLAHLPLLLHGHAEDVLVIGLASGITSGAALRHPVKRLDVVDVVGSMPLATAHFDRWNGRPLEDPRTTFIADDARSLLATTTRRWDVIVSEPSNPWTAGTGALFTSDFYRSAARRLKPGGAYVQWLQSYELGDELLAAVVRSFREGFASVTLWETATGDTMLVGSAAPIVPDLAAIDAGLGERAVAEQVASLRILRGDDLLFLQRFSPVTIDWIAAGASRENTDDNMLLESEAPRDLFLRRIPRLLDDLDERRVGAASLPWTQETLRASREDSGFTPATLGRVMGGRLFGSARLTESWIAAWSRTSRIPVPEIVASLGGVMVDGAPVPPSQEELLGRLRHAAGLADPAALGELVEGARTSIVHSALMSATAASAWSEELDALAGRSTGAGTASIRLLRSDVLGAIGDRSGAETDIEAALRAHALPAGEVLLRACRLDDGPPCDAMARRLLTDTGDERVARFLELRARR